MFFFQLGDNSGRPRYEVYQVIMLSFTFQEQYKDTLLTKLFSLRLIIVMLTVY